jgi:hypothetical protein
MSALAKWRARFTKARVVDALVIFVSAWIAHFAISGLFDLAVSP